MRRADDLPIRVTGARGDDRYHRHEQPRDPPALVRGRRVVDVGLVVRALCRLENKKATLFFIVENNRYVHNLFLFTGF